MRRIAAVLLLFLLVGCTATPFTAEGIARAVGAATPALRGLAGPQDRQGASAPCPGGDVTVVLIMPDFGRPWWAMPFAVSDIGSHKTYVIVLGGKSHAGETADCPHTQAAGVPAK